jgi:hypothetical protein
MRISDDQFGQRTSTHLGWLGDHAVLINEDDDETVTLERPFTARRAIDDYGTDVLDSRIYRHTGPGRGTVHLERRPTRSFVDELGTEIVDKVR